MQVVYGPIPSRRLGRSLGIDPVPLKTCNWNCVYCQLGRTRPVVHELAEYVPRPLILEQAAQALASHPPGTIDWVTFVGSGETTLHAGLGALIRKVKALTSLPVAVITNGSLLYLPQVRQGLLAADAVLPSLDAGNARLYRRINRPHPQASFARLVQGLIAFRGEYRGRLWLQVMLIKGLNDDPASLEEIAGWVAQIRPDAVHLTLPTRPPAESWVAPSDEAGLARARAILGERAWIAPASGGDFELGGCQDAVEAVIAIITRHPMRDDELLAALERLAPGQAAQALLALQASGRAQVVERFGARFWCADVAYFDQQAAT